MTDDDITRMAREASVPNSWDLNWYDPYYERFAKLVAAAEREACAESCNRWIINGYDINLLPQAIRGRGQICEE